MIRFLRFSLVSAVLLLLSVVWAFDATAAPQTCTAPCGPPPPAGTQPTASVRPETPNGLQTLNLTGLWTGQLLQPGGAPSGVFDFQMSLVEDASGNVSGTSYSAVTGQPAYYVQESITGQVSNGVFTFQQTGIISQNVVQGTTWCVGTGQLTPTSDGKTLNGNYQGAPGCAATISISEVSGNTCNGVSIDSGRSDGALDVSFPGSCSGVMTIQNNMNFWTNFDVSTQGFVTAEPATNDLTGILYANLHLLPPNGTVQYTVTFTKPNDFISVFVDPEGAAGNGDARPINIVQIILNAIPVVGDVTDVLELGINNAQTISQALPQMPHFQNAVWAPNILTFLSEFGQFLASPIEKATFASMVGSIGASVGSDVGVNQFLDWAGEAASAPLGFFFGAIQSLGTAFELSIGNPSGSVSLTAQ